MPHFYNVPDWIIFIRHSLQYFQFKKRYMFYIHLNEYSYTFMSFDNAKYWYNLYSCDHMWLFYIMRWDISVDVPDQPQSSDSHMHPTHDHEHAHTHPQSLFIPVTKILWTSTSFIVLAIMFHIMMYLKLTFCLAWGRVLKFILFPFLSQQLQKFCWIFHFHSWIALNY